MKTGHETKVFALVVEGLTVELGGICVLDNVSFTAHSGTLVGVVGPNGGGKTTLFNAIVGLLPVQNGRILIHGKSIKEARGVVAYVPQREMVNWRFPITAWDVVMLGRIRKVGLFRQHGSKDRMFVDQCLERLGLLEHRTDLVTELSGGQRQRVFVARALAQEADVLLLDEAFSGVDVSSQEGLVSVLRELRQDGKVILTATHDLTNLASRFDEVICLNKHVCAHGHPGEVFTTSVLQELYGSHGVIFTNEGDVRHGHPS